MIRSLLSSAIFLLSIFPLLAQDKPVSYSVDRYSVIWKNSMFANQAGTPRPEPTSAAYWTLAGVFSYEGKRGAVILNEATGAVEQIKTGEANESGLTLLEVIENRETGAASVKVENRGKIFRVARPPKRKESHARPSQSMMADLVPDAEFRKTVASQ